MKEIARQCFATLNKEGNTYYILNDQNYVTGFYAKNEELAKEIFKAWLKGGFRERYAVENGNAVAVSESIVFTYSNKNEYQDANGAIWNIKRKEWVN